MTLRLVADPSRWSPRGQDTNPKAQFCTSTRLKNLLHKTFLNSVLLKCGKKHNVVQYCIDVVCVYTKSGDVDALWLTGPWLSDEYRGDERIGAQGIWRGPPVTGVKDITYRKGKLCLQAGERQFFKADDFLLWVVLWRERDKRSIPELA